MRSHTDNLASTAQSRQYKSVVKSAFYTVLYMARLYRAGKIVLDEAKHCLVVDTVQIDVDPKPFEIIRFLALNAHRMVSNQEIKNAVWDGVVTEQNYRVTLSNANARLKEALRMANPEVQPTPFYARPKLNYLKWALGAVEDVTPPCEPPLLPPVKPAEPLPGTGFWPDNYQARSVDHFSWHCRNIGFPCADRKEVASAARHPAGKQNPRRSGYGVRP